MKKTMAMLLTAVMSAALLSGCASSNETSQSQSAGSETSSSQENSSQAASGTGEGYTIGIGQYAEHGSLDNCREGFLEGLKEEGIEEGKNLTVTYKNAAADMGTAGQIADTFVSDQADLICAIATPSAQTA